MINFLETVTNYNDSWNMTFYYILVLVLLIGIFWTYMQVFVKLNLAFFIINTIILYFLFELL